MTTVFLSGGGDWALIMASKTDSAYCRPKELAMKYLLRRDAPTRNPVKYFRKYGISLQDYIDAGLLPEADRYIIDQGPNRIINDLKDDSVEVWEYIHEYWLAPTVSNVDVLLLRDFPFQVWLKHFYPDYWYSAKHHYLFPMATLPDAITETDYSEERVGMLGYGVNDHFRIFGERWEDQPLYWKSKSMFEREIYFKLQESEQFFYQTDSLSHKNYYHELSHLQKLITMQPQNHYALSRRVLDCAFAGVIPLLYDPFNDRDQLKVYLNAHEFPLDCLYPWSTFEELVELADRDLLSEYDPEPMREWAQEFTYEQRTEGFERIIDEVAA